MIRRINFIWIAFIALGNVSMAQMAFDSTYGGSDNDYGIRLMETSDAGFLLLGNSFSFGQGEQDVYLIKTNSSGKEEWSGAYGTSDWDVGVSMAQDHNGNYIITGSANGLQSDSIFILSIDSSGNENWRRKHELTGFRDVGQYIAIDNDSGFVIAGFNDTLFTENLFLLKTNDSGNILWSNTHISTGKQIAVYIDPLPSGNYFVFGETNVSGTGGSDFYLFEADTSGDTVWTRTYGDINDDIGKAADRTSDGGHILLGDLGKPKENLYLIKVDSAGEKEWSSTFGSSGRDRGNGVKQTSDGGYVLAGIYDDPDKGHGAYLVKTDSEGELEWERMFFKGDGMEAWDVVQTTDGGYAVTGTVIDIDTSNGSSDRNIFLLKLDDQGELTFINTFEVDVQKIQLSPNPSIGWLNVKVNQHKNSRLSLKIFNVSGALIFTDPEITSGYNLDTSAFGDGIFLVSIYENGKLLESTQLVNLISR
ncbi:MAG: T9SS type A sorting domain-containing protein [Bacteroidetes bacterium]|nr:T9SS type A sorting domain-containing protein [Bacteroidota bacterium]